MLLESKHTCQARTSQQLLLLRTCQTQPLQCRPAAKCQPQEESCICCCAIVTLFPHPSCVLACSCAGFACRVQLAGVLGFRCVWLNLPVVFECCMLVVLMLPAMLLLLSQPCMCPAGTADGAKMPQLLLGICS